MLQSDLCDYSDAFTAVKGTFTVRGMVWDRKNRSLAFNNASFISCITKTSNVLIDNAEDLDVVLLMYNLMEYIKIIEKPQVVYGTITEMRLIILLLTTIM